MKAEPYREVIMQYFITFLEIIGAAAFAVSGAVTALKKNMDIFGVCVMGITTATGGGVIRDIILGRTPPQMFNDSKYVVVSLIVSIIIFIPFFRHFLTANKRIYEAVLLVTDSAGLGIFTVYGVKVAIDAGYADNTFLVLFVALVTGVGGGVLRDIFAHDRPYIFIKHIYACAALAGAVLCRLLWNGAGQSVSMVCGLVLVILIRLLSAKYKLSLPKATDVEL